MKRIKRYLAIGGMAVVGIVALSSCTGRTAENMKPAGETVHVVIPESDVVQDSVIANS